VVTLKRGPEVSTAPRDADDDLCDIASRVEVVVYVTKETASDDDCPISLPAVPAFDPTIQG